MRVPQEIVDGIIDYFGVPLDEPRCHDRIFYRRDIDRGALDSWALVSKACNDRVRYYLFSHCKIIVTPSYLREFARCPDVLLKYTRFLYICRPRNLEEIRTIVIRFSSSPLIRVKFVSAQILDGFPAVLWLFLPRVRCVHFERCLFDPVALVRLRGHLELQEMAVGGCMASGILESIEDIGAGIPRRLPDRVGGIDEVVGDVLRSLRALRLQSTADHCSENELIRACAGSLQFIEIRAKKDWSSSPFCLDVGMCSKLRSITFEGSLSETSTISTLVTLLSTLRNPQNLWRVRVLAKDSSVLDFAGCLDSQVEVWRRLDVLLCGLCSQLQKEDGGAGLKFQVASRRGVGVIVKSGRLRRLLPKFSRVGTCEEVKV